MSYIDADYYIKDYQGETPVDPESLPKLIKRASEVIDQITGYKLKISGDFEDLYPFIKHNVELATAKQVEYFIVNGGYELFVQKDDVQSANVGSFSYSIGNRSSTGKAEQDKSLNVPSSVYAILAPTGLLNSGIGVKHG